MEFVYLLLCRVKGLLYTQSAITECEKTVTQYEKIVADRSHPTTDIETLKNRNDVFQVIIVLVNFKSNGLRTKCFSECSAVF